MEKARNNKKRIFLSIIAIISIILVGLVLSAIYLISTYKPYETMLSSMSPSMLPGEKFIISKRIDKSNLERGNIVTYKDKQSGRIMVQRIIGLPNETITIKQGTVYIDGSILKEPYIKFKDHTSLSELKIKSNRFYVLGDNRPNSMDSRMVGAISSENITGKVILIYAPREKFGLIKNPFNNN